MRDQDRIDEILELISEIWRKNPNLRLCQLIENCFEDVDLYYLEDNDLQKALIGFYYRGNYKTSGKE